MEFVVRNQFSNEIGTAKGRDVGGVFCVHPSIDKVITPINYRLGLFVVSHVKTGFALPLRFKDRDAAVRFARSAIRDARLKGMDLSTLTVKKAKTPNWQRWWRQFRRQQSFMSPAHRASKAVWERE